MMPFCVSYVPRIKGSRFANTNQRTATSRRSFGACSASLATSYPCPFTHLARPETSHRTSFLIPQFYSVRREATVCHGADASRLLCSYQLVVGQTRALEHRHGAREP